LGDDILRGDQLDLILLPAQLVLDRIRDFRIALAQGGGEKTALRGLGLGVQHTSLSLLHGRIMSVSAAHWRPAGPSIVEGRRAGLNPYSFLGFPTSPFLWGAPKRSGHRHRPHYSAASLTYSPLARGHASQ